MRAGPHDRPLTVCLRKCTGLHGTYLDSDSCLFCWGNVYDQSSGVRIRALPGRRYNVRFSLLLVRLAPSLGMCCRGWLLLANSDRRLKFLGAQSRHARSDLAE